MLDSFIIDELKQREQERRYDEKRPVLDIPALDYDHEEPEQNHSPEPKSERGVAIVDFSI